MTCAFEGVYEGVVDEHTAMRNCTDAIVNIETACQQLNSDKSGIYAFSIIFC